ncbi:hypothetical protein E2P81_ATG00406 [Venturia nashicola]|uniref:Uncharacterized protein n=1 Tax=Venturia nashicola TaxID=86259 RepID=A0A4Z1PTP6_9PEZI|nr:hypothetical protein E6O75_ATG00415 [Venturia nashicola]TLD39419.1 hypothetical protein E2P81_ATG00406 [Venturia nashicola]
MSGSDGWGGIIQRSPQTSNHAIQPPSTSVNYQAESVGGITLTILNGCQQLYAELKAEYHSDNWSEDARESAYEPCYNGCTDCLDKEYAFHACKETADVNVPGVICDGNQIWSWQNRYPEACLEALGETYKAEFKENLLESFELRALLIAVPIVIGLIAFVLGGWTHLRVYRRRFATVRVAAVSASNNGANIPLSTIVNPPATSPIATLPTPHVPASPSDPPRKLFRISETGASFGSELEKAWEELNGPQEQSEQGTAQGTSGKPNSKSTFRQIPAVLGIATLFGRSNAATGAPICKDNLTTRHFTNADHTIFGNVRGWLASECSEYPCHCRDVECPPNQGRISKPSNCEQKCDVCMRYTTGSLEYVGRIEPKVGYCDFEFIHSAMGEAPWRVANAMIEKNWLVTISVNTYNVSREMAEEVKCLHAIGHQFP